MPELQTMVDLKPEVDFFTYLGRRHAEDRAFQMDVLRRSAAGRLSALVGAAALADDKLQRALGMSQAAEAAWLALPSHQQAWLRAYADGINGEIGRCPSVHHVLHGARMEPWTPVHSLLVMLLLYQKLAFDVAGQRLGATLRQAVPRSVAEIFGGRTPGPPDGGVLRQAAAWLRQHRDGASDGLWSPVEASLGSNAWTIAGGVTGHGGAILACDLHLPPLMPGLTHVAGAGQGPDAFAGAAIPGLPVLVAGSTARLAWGVTNVPGDTLEFVPLAACGPVAGRVETIEVRGGDSVAVEAWDTPLGPVWPEPVAGERVAACWSALWPGSLDLGLSELIGCATIEQALDVGRQAGGPPLNLHLAAGDGQTAQTICGRVPQRAAGTGLREERWRPWHAVPVRRPGPDGILVSANDADAMPEAACGANHPPAWRARRIRQLLGTRSDWTERSVFEAQRDTQADFLRPYRDLAAPVLAGPSPAFWPEKDFADAARAIGLWDGTCGADAIGAAFLFEVRRALVDRLAGPAMRIARTRDPLVDFALRDSDGVILALLDLRDPDLLDGSPTWDEALARLLQAVQARMVGLTGRTLARSRWKDCTPLRAAPAWPSRWLAMGGDRRLPSDGAADCVRAASRSAHSAFRMVASPGRLGEALVATPSAQRETNWPLRRSRPHRLWMQGRASRLLQAARGVW